jgi:pSer/pThr/pTyr-binding forkhead associated (FHA) protein
MPQQQGWAANAPAQPAAGWGGQMPGGPIAGGYDAGSGFGEGDKTRIVRPGNGQQRIGMIVIRQGKEPGRVFELRKDRLTIGRSRESDIFLEDLAVSRLHTTVNSDGNGHYIIRDEGSANGTYVNQQRVTEQALEEGDEIQVGQTVLAFVRR